MKKVYCELKNPIVYKKIHLAIVVTRLMRAGMQAEAMSFQSELAGIISQEKKTFGRDKVDIQRKIHMTVERAKIILEESK